MEDKRVVVDQEEENSSREFIVQHAGQTQTYLIEGSSEAGSVFDRDSTKKIHSIEPNMRYDEV